MDEKVATNQSTEFVKAMYHVSLSREVHKQFFKKNREKVRVLKMKKSIVLCAVLFLILWVSSASGSSFTVTVETTDYEVQVLPAVGGYEYDNSGTYLGTVLGIITGGTDAEAGVVFAVFDYLHPGLLTSLDAYGKLGADGEIEGETLYINTNDWLSGTWATYAGWNPLPG
ncbi:MAG: hypothetical protein JW836_16570 [Deltaproteobacteria bacterium]|nr:hypothetical protein [Deltaproteobacteria bacterium]